MTATEYNEELIEQDVIRAFGSAIIEFEAVLYQKFLVISATHSLVSERMFKKILNDMHAKGYITPTEFQGKSCWKREIVLEDLEEAKISPEEFEQVFKERDLRVLARDRASRPKERVVTDSSSIAREITATMLRKMYKGKSPEERVMRDIKNHASQMRKALSNSEREFLEYVRRNTPLIYDEMRQLLRENGENLVLLGLRLVSAS